MKRFILIALSLALCVYGWLQIRDYAWITADAPRWNPFAIKESGFGRTLARVLTEQANASYHHGLFERRPPTSTNPLSYWLDAGNVALGFRGRLKYRPIDQYPLRPYEVKQALEQVEKNLRLAFELDPGNYTAYDVYLFFLTNEVTQTEFASLAGAQLENKDAEDDTDSEGDTQEQQARSPRSAEGQHDGAQAQATGDHNNAAPGKQTSDLQRWAEMERRRRHTRAIEITDEAIWKFRPNTMDPERFLTAAVMWYNRFMLLAPDTAERQKSAEARRKFVEVGWPALNKMRYYIQAAKACQRDLEAKGLWQTIPERRKEYFGVMQLLEKCAFTLSVALQVNRSQVAQDGLDSRVWRPTGQN
jgi:hypothetical protein